MIWGRVIGIFIDSLKGKKQRLNIQMNTRDQSPVEEGETEGLRPIGEGESLKQKGHITS